MSQEKLEVIIELATSDPAFRRKLIQDPDGTLKPYLDRKDITTDEADAIKAIKEAVWEGIHDTVEQQTKRKWYQPANFREFASGALTLVIVFIVLYVLGWLVDFANTNPKGITIGSNTETVDYFQRTKDLFLIVLPLLSAAISYWLGVTVEGKRADAAQEQADQANASAKQSIAQTSAVLDQASPGALIQARNKFPELFQAWGG
jgi:F0F1-type ATP synthase assembly protein I